MIYIGIMSNEECLCALFTGEGLWRVTQMLLWVIWEWMPILGKRSPSLSLRSYFIRLHLRHFKQLWTFPFIFYWSCVSVLKLSRGENKPWKRFVPVQVSNRNLRTFKAVHIHLMHTYHGIKQQPFNCQLESRKWLPLKIALFQQSNCSQTTQCILYSMKLTNQNSRSRSTFGNWRKTSKWLLKRENRCSHSGWCESIACLFHSLQVIFIFLLVRLVS